MNDWYEIRTKQSSKWQPQIAATFCGSLMEHIKTWLDLRIIGTQDQIRWVIHSSSDNNLSLDIIQKLVQAYYPDAEIIVDPAGWAIKPPLSRRIVILARSPSNFFETMVDVQSLGRIDPLATMVQTLSALKPDEVISYHVSINRVMKHSENEVKEMLTMSAYDAGDRYTTHPLATLNLADLLVSKFANHIRNQKLKDELVNRFDQRETTRYLAKLNQKLVEVAVFLRFDTPHPERLQVLTDAIASVKHLTTGGISYLIDGIDQSFAVQDEDTDDASWPQNIWNELAEKKELTASLYLTADELATLWHLPHDQFITPDIEWADDSIKPMPGGLKNIEEGIQLGKNGDNAVLLPPDERTSHLIAVGKTGTGKSTFLYNMISQDIALGHGICVIDPHGDLVKSVLRYGIPENREEDVVVLDLANNQYPVPLNLLHCPDGIANDVAVNMMMSVMMSIFDEMAFTEMGDTLYSALLTLTSADNPTLLDISRLFNRPEFRLPLVEQLDDLVIDEFWERFDKMKEGRQNEMVRPVMRRLNTFFSNKQLRATSCHPQSINLLNLIKSNKIILVSLAGDEAQLPEEQRNVLGASLIAQIQMAAMSGAIPKPPFMLYVDEAQNFVTTALDKMLSESRKRGLGLVLSNQYLKQLVGKTLDAIEGNVATLVSFEVGEPDARTLGAYVKPQFQLDDLTHMGKYRAAVSMRHNASRHASFTLETLPTDFPTDERLQELALDREKLLRQKSIEKYTPMTFEEINAWLNKRYRSRNSNSTNGAEQNVSFIEPKS